MIHSLPASDSNVHGNVVKPSVVMFSGCTPNSMQSSSSSGCLLATRPYKTCVERPKCCIPGSSPVSTTEVPATLVYEANIAVVVQWDLMAIAIAG